MTAQKIENNYDVVAQLLSEMCDGGAISTTEGNALREVVEVEGFLNKLLGSINLPGYSILSNKVVYLTSNISTRKPASNTVTAGAPMQGISSLSLQNSTNTQSLPWRRSNVKHTSNELYVDLIEALSVTLAPSGRPLSAFAYGTIAFTAKISGVPDLLLTLSSPSGKHNLESVMELPVFHPCVRLARWKERPGELSFIPPDGRFVLAGYEVDLLPFTSGNGKLSTGNVNLKLPATIEVKTSLGQTGSDFEVHLQLSKILGSTAKSSSALMSLQSVTSSMGNARTGAGQTKVPRLGSGLGTSAPEQGPQLEDLRVSIPISTEVRTLSDIRASRGEIHYNPGDTTLEWTISAKETSTGIATLRATIIPKMQDEDEDMNNGLSFEDERFGYQENDVEDSASTANQTTTEHEDSKDRRKIERNKILMPRSANVSFSCKGWLASGIKVEGLVIDKAKSRGLGDGVKPYKGVKYLTISRGGVETRC